MAELKFVAECIGGDDDESRALMVSCGVDNETDEPYVRFELAFEKSFCVTDIEDIEMLAMYCTQVLALHDKGAL